MPLLIANQNFFHIVKPRLLPINQVVRWPANHAAVWRSTFNIEVGVSTGLVFYTTPTLKCNVWKYLLIHARLIHTLGFGGTSRRGYCPCSNHAYLFKWEWFNGRAKRKKHQQICVQKPFTIISFSTVVSHLGDPSATVGSLSFRLRPFATIIVPSDLI